MPYHIIGLGEILWDVFPDERRFGGAPANFACSAAELARSSARVHMISAVGDDDLGREALASLERRGVRTSAVQTNQHPTGTVLVELDARGVASYRFAADCAWDYIDWTPQLRELAADCDAVCFGTLGQRGELSRKTIRTFVEATPDTALRILDVNLRTPYWDDSLILDSLRIANVLKLNEEELPIVVQAARCGGGGVEAMRQLADRFNLRCVALTRGPHGAILLAEDTVHEHPGMETRVVDTVGAGDAYTASMTLDLLAGRSIDQINQNAIATASYVCSQPGATMSFPEALLRGC